MSLQTCVFFLFTSVFLLPNEVHSLEFQCKTEGRFAVPFDCSLYIDCVFNPKTGLLGPRKGMCGKGGFHPKQKTCVDQRKLKGCHARRARLDHLRIDLNHMCTDGSEFVCADCKTLVYCIRGVAYAQPCTEGDICQVRESFSGAVCHPEQIDDCICQKSNEFKRDPFDDRSFLFCDDYALPTYYKCSEEMVFDPYIKQCVSAIGLPPCKQIGVFADHDDCRKYYTCIQSERGWVQKLFQCPRMTMFSEITMKCEDPCKWFKGEFTCKEEGRFQDLTDCSNFYECVALSASEFRKSKRSCPAEMHWRKDQDKNTGSCILKEDSQCEPKTPTLCDVPPDWCSFDINQASTVTGTFQDTIFVGPGPAGVPDRPTYAESEVDSPVIIDATYSEQSTDNLNGDPVLGILPSTGGDETLAAVDVSTDNEGPDTGIFPDLTDQDEIPTETLNLDPETGNVESNINFSDSNIVAVTEDVGSAHVIVEMPNNFDQNQNNSDYSGSNNGLNSGDIENSSNVSGVDVDLIPTGSLVVSPDNTETDVNLTDDVNMNTGSEITDNTSTTGESEANNIFSEYNQSLAENSSSNVDPAEETHENTLNTESNPAAPSEHSGTTFGSVDGTTEINVSANTEDVAGTEIISSYPESTADQSSDKINIMINHGRSHKINNEEKNNVKVRTMLGEHRINGVLFFREK